VHDVDARKGRLGRVALAGCALLASVCLLPAAAAGQAARHLVVPFENLQNEARLHWLMEASAVILTDDLIALGVPAIRRDDRLRAFDRLRVPAVTSLSHATVIRLGQVVGAAEVVVGGFDVDAGQQLTVRARAIRLDTGSMAPEIVESGPLNDIFDVYARVARRLVPGSAVTAEQMERGHPPIAALEQYIKGLLAEAPESKISFLAQALRIDPALHRARIALWSVHTGQGEYKEALAAVGAVPADHRLSRQARFLTGVSLLHLNRYQQAFDTLVALQAQAPDAALLNNLGIVQLRRPAGAVDRPAVAYFSDAAQMDVGDSDLFFNLGYAHALNKDPVAAIYWLREAVRRNPADDAAHYVLGVALQSTGSAAEAAREKELARQLSSEYGEWEKRQPVANTVPRGLERVKTDLDVPAALRVENVIVASGQRDQRELAAFHLEAGRRAYQAERDAEAIAELRRAVYLSPYDSDAHLLLARAYLRSGRLNEAIDALKISIWSLDTLVARLVLVDAYIQARDDASARADLQTILKMDPGNAEALRLLERLP
jgi:tetratricopeptide (TPR) repeat protein